MRALCKNLLVGVTGSISVVSIPGHIAFLRRGMVENVRVILTESAAKMISPATFEAYAGQAAFTDSFESRDGIHVPHIDLTRDADLFLIMPATANVIAKAALGIADDLLTTAILACAAPVVFVPCMNERMWFNPAVQRNVQTARSNGYHVIEPAHGMEIADLQKNYGVMAPLDKVIAFLADVMPKRS
jgi:phosphopantothenoylcysteine synthetase/decarboxylase